MRDDGGVQLDVVNRVHEQRRPDQAGLGVTGAGRGLLGISERVRMLNGTLEAGRGPDGEFHVRASVPEPSPRAAS